MEKIVVHKKNLKHYFFVNYVLYNYDYKKIQIIFNDIVSDDIEDLVEEQAHSLIWDNNKEHKTKIKIDDELYISSGLKKFIVYFNQEKLITNFNKFILVSFYQKLKDRMNYI